MGFYRGSRALNTNKASIFLGDEKRSCVIDEDNQKAIFDLPLQEGDYHLENVFETQEGHKLSAYYASVQRIG